MNRIANGKQEDCRTNNYHQWDIIGTLHDDYETITFHAVCVHCGAEAEATGDIRDENGAYIV
tara:strand:- start:308 stop:493 length:186 start_codon:yes stop_codon:yes gene_type:complete